MHNLKKSQYDGYDVYDILYGSNV